MDTGRFKMDTVRLLIYLLVLIECRKDVLGMGTTCEDQCNHPDANCVNNQCRCSGIDYNEQTCLPTVSNCDIYEDNSLAKSYIEGKSQKVYSCEPSSVPYSDTTLDSVHILSTHNLPTHNTSTELVLTAAVTLNFDEAFSGEVILVLSCYEDILWKLYIQPNGRVIDRVILISSQDCGVRYVPHSAVSKVQVLPNPVEYIPFGYGNDTVLGDTPGLIRLVEDTYGPVTSFYGSFSADHWELHIKEAPMTEDNPSKPPVQAPRNPNNGRELQPPTTSLPPLPFPIRLMGGSNSQEGRLEVFHDNIWGTVCDNGWNDLASYVACKQLGHKGAVGFTSRDIERNNEDGGVVYSKTTGRILLTDVLCNGTETGLAQCEHGPFLQHNCFFRESIELTCAPTLIDAQTNIRLTACDTNIAPCHAGLVEVLYENKWATICDDTWNMDIANAVCQQLDFKAATGATPGGLVPSEGEEYVNLKLISNSKHSEDNRLVVSHGKVCSHGVGAKVACSRYVQEGKKSSAHTSETTKGGSHWFEYFAFLFTIFMVLIIMCVVVLCMCYMCRSRNSIKVTDLPPSYNNVMHKPHLFPVKQTETPILDLPLTTSQQTPPPQYNFVVTTDEIWTSSNVQM